jgi:hypothetical protein
MIKEAVMEEGMKIIVHSQHGELKIEAKEDGKRSFTWDNETYNAKLIPRKERWFRKLGLYHPQLRPPHKNVVHMVVEEYEFNFNSIEDSIRYMNQYEGIEDIYNDNGLFIRFDKKINNLGQIAINIQIVRILIDGKIPSQLPGSQNQKIEVSRIANQ